jgi:predicted DNA-binding protein
MDFENKNKSESIFIRITPEMNAQLEALTKKYETSKSEIVRKFVEEALHTLKEEK